MVIPYNFIMIVMNHKSNITKDERKTFNHFFYDYELPAKILEILENLE